MSDAQQPLSLAERMWPSMPSAAPQPGQGATAQAPQQPTPEAAPSAAERIYPAEQPRQAEALPPEVAKLRNEPARRMFDSSKAYASSGLDKLFVDQANARDERAAWSGVLGDFEATSQEAATVVGLVNTVRAEPPTDDVVNDWDRESIAMLRERYGTRADEHLAVAQRLVARDPRVADLLVRSGLASHPTVVGLVVAKALSMRSAGRFR